MTRAISAGLFLALWASMPGSAATKPAKLPSAATILDRYVQVTGGQEHYRGFSFVTIDSSVIQADGTTIYTTIFHSRDGATKTEFDAGEASHESGVSDGIVWEFSKPKGARILNGKVAAREIAKSRGLGDDDWRERFPSAKTAGEEVIYGRVCYRVELTRTDGSAVERFYEEQSGLLMREVSTEFDEAGVEQRIQTDIETYATSLGNTFPSLMHVKMGNRAFTIQVNRVAYGGGSAGALSIPREVARAAAESRNSGALPNPVDILDRYIQVTGGKDAYQTIRTEIIKAEITLKDQNLTMPLAVYAARNKSYSFFEVPTMGKFEFGDDGRTGWQRSVVLGPRLAPRSSVGMFFGLNKDDVLAWTNASLGLETISKVDVNGSPCYQISLGSHNSTEATSTACFDVQTGYLVKTTVGADKASGANTAETVFSDYRSDGGFTTAYHLETKLAGKVVSVQYKEITLNGPLPNGIFDLPSDVQALYEKQKNQPKVGGGEQIERPTLARQPNQ